MIELYEALAETGKRKENILTKQSKNPIRFWNDQRRSQIRQKENRSFEKSGRLQQIEAERAKLPVEAEKESRQSNNLPNGKSCENTKRKNRAAYREAFGKLFENPLSGELKSGGYRGLRAIRARRRIARRKLTSDFGGCAKLLADGGQRQFDRSGRGAPAAFDSRRRFDETVGQ